MFKNQIKDELKIQYDNIKIISNSLNKIYDSINILTKLGVDTKILELYYNLTGFNLNELQENVDKLIHKYLKENK